MLGDVHLKETYIVRRRTSSILADGHPVQVHSAGPGLLLWAVVLMII